MTKTTCVIFLLLFSSWLHAEDFSKDLRTSCDLSIDVNLHDYDYGRDEARIYSNNHFEDASLLIHAIAEACKIDPSNRARLARVKTIFIKRGSIQERKLIQKRNGDIVYLATRVRSESSKNKGDLIRDDLTRVLKLSFVKPPDPKVEEKKAEEKKTEDLRAKKNEEQQKKIQETADWYTAEVKKIAAEQGPDMAKKLENLNKTYQEKINALTAP